MLEIGAPDAAASCTGCARARPAPLVPAELRFGVAERSAPARCLARSTTAALDGTLDRLADAGGRVGRRLPAALLGPARARAPCRAGGGGAAARRARLRVARPAGVFREYERTSTTVIDAYLSPLLGGYLERLCGRAAERGPARAGDHALERRADVAPRRRAATPPGPCCPGRRRARSAPRTPVALSGQRPTSSRSTWAAPRATSP